MSIGLSDTGKIRRNGKRSSAPDFIIGTPQTDFQKFSLNSLAIDLYFDVSYTTVC